MIDSSGEFIIYRCDRVNRQGGGVLSLISKSFVSYQVPLPAVFSRLELICFDVSNRTNSVRYILAYRPPDINLLGREYMSLLTQCLEFLFKVKYPVIVLGDFNLPHINWNMSSAPQDQLHNVFLDLCVHNGLYQFVDKPTHDKYCIDLILSNDPSIVSTLAVTEHFSTSDHCSIEFNVIMHTKDDIVNGNALNSNAIDTYLDFEAADYDSINYCMFNHPFNFLSSDDLPVDPNDLWDAFISPINSAVGEFVPVKRSISCRSKKRKQYPRFIRRSLNKKRLLWRKYHRIKSVENKLAYDKQSCLCRKLLFDYERCQELAVIRRNNLGSFYRFANRKLSCRSGIGPLKLSNGITVANDAEKASAFNDYFSSIFIDDDGNTPQLAKRVSNNVYIDSIFFSSNLVFKCLSKCKSSMSLDPDGLSTFFIKKLKSTLANPLAVLFTKIFDCSVIPDAWRIAHVTPVFKKGVSSAVENYRPISLTSVVCKVFERIVKEQMLEFLFKQNLITRHQHGFLSQRSTCTELLETLNDWTLSLRNRHVVDAIYFDFSKAFDSVVHNKLCTKLTCYGINGKLYNILRDFLLNRKQRVVLSNGMSSFKPVNSGVPQGSVLGPLLFLLYINDVVDLFTNNVNVKLYADDIKLYMEIENQSDTDVLQQSVDKFKVWAQTWQLSLSPQKCQHIRVSLLKPSSPVCYRIDSDSLPTVDSVRDLGVTIDPKLTFTVHTDSIVTNAHRRANQILRCFLSNDNLLLVKAFKTYVRPMLEYCSPVWSPHSLNMIASVESVQRRFTKRLTGMSDLTYKERCMCLNLEFLELRRLRCDLITCYKIIHKMTCLRPDEFFTVYSDHTTRGHSFKLHLPNARIDARKHFFAIRVVNIWNSLPAEVVNSLTIESFVKNLMTYNLTKFVTVAQ